jgi:hypothetical protein
VAALVVIIVSTYADQAQVAEIYDAVNDGILGVGSSTFQLSLERAASGDVAAYFALSGDGPVCRASHRTLVGYGSLATENANGPR